jgi:tetratricopeptide (TPR) repeat protein
MAKKPSKTTRIKRDVNVKHGDFVAGNKTVLHGEEQEPGLDSAPRKKSPQHRYTRDIEGTLEVDSGDVVFGNKIIKFFQEQLNVYLFKDVKQLAFFLSTVLFVSGAIAGGIWYSNQPMKMTGNFNIAVAQFGEIQTNGEIEPSARAESISGAIFNFLDSEYKSAGLKVTVSHKNVPLITENIQAEKLAQQIHAHMIIYGTVYFQGEKAEFSPRFYVSTLPDTDELTGQNELAYPIPFESLDLSSMDKVNLELRRRTAILFNFTKGLIYLSQGDVDNANRSIQSAIHLTEKLPSPFAGQEVLYLFASHIQLQQKQYQNANDYLDQALELNPQYARAYLARGNIYYAQALSHDFDTDLLMKAYDEYELAYQAPNQPDGAYIPAKAHTGLGNILVLLAQETDDPDLFARAIENYSYIIKQYEETHNPILRDNTTIAYFGLGAAYERQGKIEQAIKMYEQAYALSENPEFKARIQANIKALRDK